MTCYPAYVHFTLSGFQLIGRDTGFTNLYSISSGEQDSRSCGFRLEVKGAITPAACVSLRARGQSAERPVPSRCSFSFSFIWLQRRACFLFICLLTLMFLLGKWPISPLLAFPLLIFRSTLHITDMTSTSLYALQILVLSQSVVDLLSLFIHL